MIFGVTNSYSDTTSTVCDILSIPISGNTVNVASRMDSTGENWKIQVPDYTAQMLISKGYTCVVGFSIDFLSLR